MASTRSKAARLLAVAIALALALALTEFVDRRREPAPPVASADGDPAASGSPGTPSPPTDRTLATNDVRRVTIASPTAMPLTIRILAADGSQVPIDRAEAANAVHATYRSNEPVALVVWSEQTLPWVGVLSDPVEQVTLDRLTTFTLRARTRSGAPVAGLELAIEPPTDAGLVEIATVQRLLTGNGERRRPEVQRLLALASRGNRCREAPATLRTDADGVAEFHRVAMAAPRRLLVRTARALSLAHPLPPPTRLFGEDEWSTSASDPGWAIDGLVAEGHRPIELVLADGATIVGRIEGSTGSAELHVTVRSLHTSRRGRQFFLEAQAALDPDATATGSFAVSGLSPGPKWLSLRWKLGDDWHLCNRAVTVPPETVVDIGLQRADAGTVTFDLAALPAGRSRVVLHRVLAQGGADDLAEELLLQHSRVNSVHGVPDGDYALHLPDDASDIDAPKAFAVAGGTARVVFTMRKEITLQVRGGREGERVRLVMNDLDMLRSQSSNAVVRDGSVRISPAAGMTAVRVEVSRNTEWLVGFARLDGGSAAMARLVPARKQRGRLHRDGKPVVDQLVEARWMVDGVTMRHRAPSGPDGTFEIGPLPLGAVVTMVGCNPSTWSIDAKDEVVPFELLR